MAGGITNTPPTGFHAIHIVVKQGNAMLSGVVNNEGDSAIANMQASSGPGVFSVDNNIDVPGSTPEAAAK
jgi:hyperosmotically inducible periplasmic protein